MPAPAYITQPPPGFISDPDLSKAGALYGDYLTGALQLGRGPNAPNIATLRDGLQLPAFAGTGAQPEDGFFTVHILHDIKAGSTPTFHVHWTHNNASPSGDVKWQIELSAAIGYSAGTFGASTTLTTTQTAGAQYTHHITSDDDMPLPAGIVAAMEPDMMLICRLFRDQTDAADTFADDAFLVGVDLHYEMGQLGTPERNRPFAGFP